MHGKSHLHSGRGRRQAARWTSLRVLPSQMVGLAAPALLVLLVSASHALATPSSLTGAAEQIPLLPRDEALSRPDFFGFRARVIAAISRRDWVWLRSALADDVKVSLGPEPDGVEAFEALWRPQSQDSPLWGALGETLALGGSFVGEHSFVSPYVFSTWPAEFAELSVAITAASVRLREAPSGLSRSIGTLSFCVVVEEVDLEASARGWTRVRLADRRVGYVASEFVRRPYDLRVVMERRHGQWKITALVAGD